MAMTLLAMANARAYYSTNYGSFSGLDVNFLNVSETTITETNQLYYAPIVSLNTIDFNPQGFGAFASGAGGFDLTDGELTMIIHANPGKSIPSIFFWEVGDFTLAGSGTAATWVDVTANFYINVYEVNGSPITPVNISGSMNFAPTANGLFTLPVNPGVGNAWAGTYSLDLDAALALAGYANGGATKVSFKLDNELYALSEAGTVARIQKKDFQGSVGIEVIVPEPSTFALMLCGAGLLFARRKAS